MTEIPLVVKPGEDRALLAIMEAGRSLYNAVLGEALRRLSLRSQSKAWQAARLIQDSKARITEYSRITTEFGFYEYALHSFATQCKNEAGWNNRLGAAMTQTVATQAFAAVQQFAFSKRGKPRFKGKSRPLHSIAGKSNTTNIRWRPEVGCVIIGELALPVKLPTKDQDPYLHEALSHRTKFCRIVWRMLNGKRRWYAQLAQEGKAPVKYGAIAGAVVGLDIGPSTIAVVGDGFADLIKFCATVERPKQHIRRAQRALARSKRVTNPHCFNADGTAKRGQKFTPSKAYTRQRLQLAEIERKLAAERKRSHGELANRIITLGNVIQSETLSYRSFQKNYGRSVRDRAPGMFVELLRRKAESAGGEVRDLNTRKLKMSQYDHTTQMCTRKPLSLRWHSLGDGSGVVQRDIYSAFLASCVIDHTHHVSQLESSWAAQESVLVQAGWLRDEPAKIEPSGKITVAAPSERVACSRGFAIGHGRDAVVARREPGSPDGFALRTPLL